MNIITRDQWGAREPTKSLPSINPSSRTGHWNGPEIKGYDGIIADHNRCYSLVRGIQNYHMDANGWSDIAYNGVPCPHGYLFEGRGFGIRSAANGTNTANSQSEAFCYLGGQNNPFTNEGKSVFAELGITKGHRDWFATQCPGDEIYNEIQNGFSGIQPVPPPGPVPVPVFDIGDFPLPSGHWYGPPSNNPRNHSGFYWANDRLGISRIQEALNPWYGNSLKVDGRYGDKTAATVHQYQIDAQIDVDGLTGQETWDKLRSETSG